VISALLVVSQLIWLGLYRSYNVRIQSEYLANQIASVIGTVSVALETMPPAVRRKFSERLPAHHNIKLLPATAWDDEDVPLPQSPLLRAIGEALRREVADDAQALVLLEDATRALWIKIKSQESGLLGGIPPESRGSRVGLGLDRFGAYSG